MISSIYKKFFKKFPYTLQFSGIISLCLLAIYGILYLRNFEKEIGHYSFCFRGKDGTLWVADPRFSNRCLKFTSKSEILKFLLEYL